MGEGPWPRERTGILTGAFETSHRKFRSQIFKQQKAVVDMPNESD